MSSVPLAENPAPSEASAKMTKPPTYACLRPKRSDSRPAVRTSTVEAIMYARITQTSPSRLVPRERSKSGRAMMSVPELMVARSIPKLVHERAHHL